MKAEFPPHASHLDELRSLLQTFAAVIEGRNAFYVSSPLTSGERAFEWHTKNERSREIPADFASDFLREVVEPNRNEARRFVRDLRNSLGAVIIDPTALPDIPGWTQADYQVFWGTTIEKYVDRVVFRNGWQYSNGCAYEFYVARSAGIRTLREDLTELTEEDGLELLNGALTHVTRSGRFLEAVRDALLKPYIASKAPRFEKES